MRLYISCILTLAIAAVPLPVVSSHALAISTALRDAKTIPYKDRVYQRYLWVPEQGEDRKKFRTVFKLHINLLSRYSEIVDIVEVASYLWRIDSRHPIWDLATYENATASSVHFHERFAVVADRVRVESLWPGGRDRSGRYFRRGYSYETYRYKDLVNVSGRWLPAQDIIQLRKLLYTEVPILHGWWFLAQSARQLNIRNRNDSGLGYYDFLKLKNRNDYFKLIGLDDRNSKRLQRDMRAALEQSGVNPNGSARQIIRFGAQSGGAWVTLDTNDPSGRGIAIANLKDGEFKHQAEEWYGFLPNDLPAFFLGNDKGVRQDFAPGDAFGFRDNSALNESGDGRIHICIACIRCHRGDVLKPIDDYIRKTYNGALGLGAKKTQDVLDSRRRFFSDINKRLAKDRRDYVEAFAEATRTLDFPKGLDADTASRYYAETFHRYLNRPITLEMAAVELGVASKQFKANLEFNWKGPRKRVDPRLTPFLASPKSLTISRATFEDVYPQAALIAHGLMDDGVYEDFDKYKYGKYRPQRSGIR